MYSIISATYMYIFLFLSSASAVFWLEYANLERQHGEPNQLRTIFKRALTTNTDWPQCIAEEWLIFERDSGTLEDVLKCQEKTKDILKTQIQSQYHTEPMQQSQIKKRTESRSDPKSKRRRFEDEERTESSKKGL